MTHICFICPGLYPYLNPTEGVAAGGSQRQQYLLLNGLAERGYEVSAIVGDNNQPFHDSVQNIDIFRGIEYTHGLKKIKNVYPLFKSMKRANPDFFYLRGAPQLFTASYIINSNKSSKIIFSLSNDSNIDKKMLSESYNRLFINMYKNCLSGSDYVVAQTEKQYKMLNTQNVGCAGVIPNGYSVPPLEEVKPHESREYVLWVGSTDRQKRPDRLLDIVKKTPSVDYVIICRNKTSSKEYNQLRAKFESYNNVNFLSTVSPHKIHTYYKNAAILINTSDYEGFPNTFLEAWRYETPVISTKFDVDNILNCGNVGILSGSLDQMADDVESLFQSLSKRKSMGSSSRDLVENNFHISDIIGMYDKLITQS